jgi:hypothetical protein
MDITVVQWRFCFFEGRVERLVSMRRRRGGAVGLVGYVVRLTRRIAGEVGMGVGDVGRTRLLGHSSESID